MHVVATNLCVWLRILVRESVKEVTLVYGGVSQDYMIREGDRRLWARLGVWNTTETTPEPYGYDNGYGGGSYGYGNTARPTAQPFGGNVTTTPLPLNVTCNQNVYITPIMKDAAPYLFPVVIEYSLIAAAVVFVMWRNIGRNVPPKRYEEKVKGSRPKVKYQLSSLNSGGDEGEEQQQEWEEGRLNGEPGPMGPVDCVGASKGLFCGLLLLVTALICLILFFVLIEGRQLKWLAIYLADCSHAALLVLSFLATLIGFIR